MTAASLRATAWAPGAFDDYHLHYPATPKAVAGLERHTTAAFESAWGDAPTLAALRERAACTSIVFVRGFLGNCMPGNLVAPMRAARALGFDAFIARNRAGAVIDDNAAAIARHVRRRSARTRLVFCGHSRGAVECLALLATNPDLAGRCAGVAAAQMPSSPSRVMASILFGDDRDSLRGWHRRAVERTQRVALHAIRATPGARELAGDGWSACLARVVRAHRQFPVVQTATWSIRPTAWLDSFHERLDEIAPGHAHDGQFYLDGLVWPGLPHVLLGRVDHAQPAVGGFGFDQARFWLALLVTVLGLSADAGIGVSPLHAGATR